MTALRGATCLHHPERPAAACCPQCRRTFCRECVTEHEDRVLCAACLERLARRPSRSRPRFGAALRWAHAFVGLVLAWLAFYALARGLLALPDAFHDGTLWKNVAGEVR